MIHKLVGVLLFCTGVAVAHNSYTGGYSGAPGRQTCASSCHGGTNGTLVVVGFPAVYQPLQSYVITVTHNGGSKIVNYNATTRVGTSSIVAGVFANVSNSVVYTGADGGVYASPHAIDTAVFRWTAPAAGTGEVRFYSAAFQGTTSSNNGQSSTVTATAAEMTTGVAEDATVPTSTTLLPNFPNPFNSSTVVRYTLSKGSEVRLEIFNAKGQRVASLLNEFQVAGMYDIPFDASNLASGIYMCRLQAGGVATTGKLLLIK